MMNRIRVRGEVTISIGYRDNKLTWEEARILRDALTAMLANGEETDYDPKDKEIEQ